MKISQKEFLQNLAKKDFTNTDKAVAVTWWNQTIENYSATTLREIDSALQNAGYAKQNLSRLAKSLTRDSRIIKVKSESFRVNVTELTKVNETFSQYAGQRELVDTGSFISIELTKNTRGYIEKVAAQINSSYDNSLFDCCAVMCRRLLETLIIEVYEGNGQSDKLKGNDKHFKMFSGLLKIVEADNAMSISRNGMKGLQDFKKLGDLSAHNRTFNASLNDLERIRLGFRVAIQELVSLANFRKNGLSSPILNS